MTENSKERMDAHLSVRDIYALCVIIYSHLELSHRENSFRQKHNMNKTSSFKTLQYPNHRTRPNFQVIKFHQCCINDRGLTQAL